MKGSEFRAAPRYESVVDLAIGILMDRRACTLDEAFALLSNSAWGHDMTVSELAGCLVAQQDLAGPPQLPQVDPHGSGDPSDAHDDVADP